MNTYRITEDSATGTVAVTHQERRVDLTKAGAPRKDGRTSLVTVIDGEFTGENRWDLARAARADLVGDVDVAARIRANIAADATAAAAPAMSAADLFARLTA